MNDDKKIILGDLLIILFLVYMYLWRLGPWHAMPRSALSLYFLGIAVSFYLLLRRFFKLNHWATLLGVIVFSFSGSELTLAFNFNKIPYPGMLAVFILFLYFGVTDKKIRLLYLVLVTAFILATVCSIMNFAPMLNSVFRLLFNLSAGIIVALGFNNILNRPETQSLNVYQKRMKSWFYDIWLLTLLLFIPLAYALLILFIETDKQLIPNIVSSLVMFEIYLSWMLIVLHKEKTRINEIIPFISIFLISVDIFTHWVVGIA